MALSSVTLIMALTISAVHASYADRVADSERDIALLNEGFSEEAVRQIKLAGTVIAVNKICGETYMPSAKAMDVLQLIAKKVDVPENILIAKAVQSAATTIGRSEQDTRFALAFCKEFTPQPSK